MIQGKNGTEIRQAMEPKFKDIHERNIYYMNKSGTKTTYAFRKTDDDKFSQ